MRKLFGYNDDEVIDKNGKDIVFTFKTNDAHNTVQLCGSFGNWQVRYPLTYDSNNHQWTTQLKIKKGIHYYKYLVDGQWVIAFLAAAWLSTAHIIKLIIKCQYGR